jgi:acetolactate synthase I/II/III large subunit
MNGAESLVHTLIACGIKVCFANPGTSEMHFVAALDRIPGLRCVPGMQENVVTGMADGYGRIMRKPAATLLHCGPGLANGLANLHNAKRARSPVVNIVGDQATYHAAYDPPLAADTSALAATVSHWVRTSQQSADVGCDGADAVCAAMSGAGQIATLILPSDSSWNDGGKLGNVLMPPPSRAIVSGKVSDASRTLAHKSNVLLLLGAEALLEDAQRHAARIATKTGCLVMAESINGFHSRGCGRLPLDRVPYGADAAIAALKDIQHIVLVGARNPVGFFAYPGRPSLHAPHDVFTVTLCDPGQNAADALALVADEIGASVATVNTKFVSADVPKGLPSSEGFGRMLAAVLPENAIVVDESISFGVHFFAHSHAAAPHDWLMVTGGAIGYGMPCATGVALAGEGRRVINAQADGSAMYTIQSLWTQARENLPVTTVILNNGKYQILLGEYSGVGANPGRTALDMLDLGNPPLDFVKIANGMGVEAVRSTTLEHCAAMMLESFKSTGPFLIELMI